MYFEHQAGKDCVIHSWNNMVGERELTLAKMKETAQKMSKKIPRKNRAEYLAQLIGENGISPNVLYAYLKEKGVYKTISVRERFHNITTLREMWNHNPAFILLGTVVNEKYRHSIGIRRVFENGKPKLLLYDSELKEPVSIDTFKQYKPAFERYKITSVTAVYTLKTVLPVQKNEIIIID